MYLSHQMMWPIPSIYRPGGVFRSRLPDDIFLAASREGNERFMALLLDGFNQLNHGAVTVWDRIVLLDIAIQARCGENALWMLRREELRIDFASLDYDTEALASSMLYDCLDFEKPELFSVAVEILLSIDENVLIEPVCHRLSNCDYWREMWTAFGRSRAEILLDPRFEQAHESPMVCYYWHHHQEENAAGVSFARYMRNIQDEFQGEYDSDEANDQSDLDDSDEEDSDNAESEDEDADLY